MEFLYAVTPNGRTKLVKMAHKGEELEWMIELYRSFSANKFVFGDINRLLANLPEQTQDKIWEQYKIINDAFNYIGNISKLTKKISAALCEIEKCFPYQTVLSDVISKDTIWTPPDKETDRMPVSRLAQTVEVTEDGREKKLSLTYDKYDYDGLNSLIIYSKLFLPVLSNFYSVIGDDERDFFRCMRTVDLLGQCEFIHERGYSRLREFIIHYWRGKDNDELAPAILVNGLARSSAIEWILANIIVRKVLPIGVSHKYDDLDPKDRPNLISGLFYFVQEDATYLVSGRDGKGGRNEYYMNKDAATRTDEGEENQTSALERYRVAGEMSEMNLVINNYFLSDIEKVIPHIDPSLTVEEVENVIYEKHRHRRYHPFRTLMMKWLMASAVSPRYIDYISSVKHGPGVESDGDAPMRNCFKICYALLMKWGFDDLAMIFDGDWQQDIEKVMIFDILDISLAQLEKINEYYPHVISSNRVKGESKRSESYPVLAAYKMEEYVKGCTFIGTNVQKKWVCQIPVKSRLADLFIYMNENNLINP